MLVQTHKYSFYWNQSSIFDFSYLSEQFTSLLGLKV